MADRPYRVTFKALPIIVHCKDEKSALNVAIEYLRQAGANRIIIEAGEEKPNVNEELP